MGVVLRNPANKQTNKLLRKHNLLSGAVINLGVVQRRLEVAASVGLVAGVQFHNGGLLQATDLIPDGCRSASGRRLVASEPRIYRRRGSGCRSEADDLPTGSSRTRGR